MSTVILALVVVYECSMIIQMSKRATIAPDLRRSQRYSAAIHLALLAAALLGITLAQSSSGYVIGAAWFVLSLLPSWGWMELNRALRAGDFATAVRWAGRLALLQPWVPWRASQAMYRCQVLLASGAWEEADRALAAGSDQPGLFGLWMRTQRHVLHGDWQVLLDLLNQTVVDDQSAFEYLGSLRVRALAEIGQFEAALREFDILRQRSTAEVGDRLDRLLLMLLAMVGRPDRVSALLERYGNLMAPNLARYWLGLAWWRAGDEQRGRTELEAVAADPWLEPGVRRVLGGQPGPPPLGPETLALLERLVAVPAGARPAPPPAMTDHNE